MNLKIIYRFMALTIWLLIGWFSALIYLYPRYGYPANIMTPIVVAIAIFYFYLLKQHKIVKRKYNEYEAGQYLEKWYTENVKRNGFEWIKATGEKINLLCKGKYIKILSIAANKGTYEKEMYKNMIKYGSKVHIMVTDIGNLEHEKDREDNESKYEYFSGIDAFKCDELLKQKYIKSVDTILDFKGAIWYQLTHKGDIEQLINIYMSILAETGLIIIDNGKNSVGINVLCYLRHLLLGLPGTEQSTYYLIRKKMRKEPVFEKFIKRHFSLENYEVDLSKKISITILKKRAC